MAKTETGWTDRCPHNADGSSDAYYFVRRKDRNDVVVMGFSMGKAWLNGVSYEPSELRSHLFLGPLSPADAEQLGELRRVAQSTLEEIRSTLGGMLNHLRLPEHDRARDYARFILEQIDKGLVALNPKQPGKETR